MLQAKLREDTTALWRTWHCQLGHTSLDLVQKSLKVAGIDICNMPKVFNCEACNTMKFICPPFGSGRNETKARLDMVVSDLQGPMPVPRLGGARYILTITDVHTHFGWVKMLVSKDATKTAVEKWLEETRQETGQYPKVFQSDNGGEYTLNAFKTMLCQRTITQQLTTPYTPQQNGITKHVNCTIMNIVQPMLDTAVLPAPLWAKATWHTNWIQNHTYSKVIGGVPYTLWSGQKVRMNDIRTFGMVVWVRDVKHGKSESKLSQHAQKCI